ncbi:MAG: NAD(P)-binding domain-containing protein [Pirellulaceae bacterium]|nr:NAD(P)-binding domain-containing protein [Pirellulaceae bacterium]
MSTSEPRCSDVVIVGAGPIGLETAIACHQAGLTATVIEAGPIGNTMNRWTPQTRWFSSNERIAIAGVPLRTPDQTKCTREQYLTYLCNVAQQFAVDVNCYQRVESVVREEDGFLVTSRHGEEICRWKSRGVVLATGGTDHPCRLGVPGEDLPHVEHRLREPVNYFSRRVLIVGGRNSAVEGALRLHHAGARVAVSYRGEEFPSQSIKYWLYPEFYGLVASGKIQAYLGTVPLEFAAGYAQLGSVAHPNQPPTKILADQVVVQIGFEQDKTLLERVGVKLADAARHPVYDPVTMETNVAGVYVAGTVIAGTQSSSYKIFLENCHDHALRIASHLSGRPLPQELPLQSRMPGNWEPES